MEADGRVKASLRDGNVVNAARHYGDGGHPNAAGFRMPAGRFVNEILGLPCPREP